MQIVRWPGPSANNLEAYVMLAARNDIGCSSGDILGATAVGSTLTIYKNGVVVGSATDPTYTDGAPGIGFFLQYDTGIITDWGFTNFAANDSGALPDRGALS
jgi:hypothetical protein